MKKSRKIAWTVVVSLILIALVAGFGTLRHQALPITEDVRVNIPQGSTYQALVDSMDAHGCIVSRAAFNTIAGLRGLPDHVKAGSYLFHPGTGIIRVIQKLYSGNQDAVRVTINKHRTDKDLCQFLSGCLTFHADSLLSLMRNDSVCALYGETPLECSCKTPMNTIGPSRPPSCWRECIRNQSISGNRETSNWKT